MNKYLLHYRIQKCTWDLKNKILELKKTFAREFQVRTCTCEWIAWADIGATQRPGTAHGVSSSQCQVEYYDYNA